MMRHSPIPAARHRIIGVAFPLALLLMAGCGQQPAEKAAPPKADTAKAALPVNGRVVRRLDDGGRIEGTMRDGRRVGPWHAYYAHGGPRSRTLYVDGVEEGPTEVFYESGLTYYVGQYHEGHEVGTWVFYDEEGNELKRAVYDSTGVLLRQDPK